VAVGVAVTVVVVDADPGCYGEARLCDSAPLSEAIMRVWARVREGRGRGGGGCEEERVYQDRGVEFTRTEGLSLPGQRESLPGQRGGGTG
jgi:hypothetical protein